MEWFISITNMIMKLSMEACMEARMHSVSAIMNITLNSDLLSMDFSRQFVQKIAIHKD